MSHFTALPSRLTDIEILQLSLRNLGIAVQTHAEVRGAGCQRVRAEVVAVLEGGYDLGWSRNADGFLDLVADLWGVARKHNPEKLISLINQQYAINQTLAAVSRPSLQKAHVTLMVQQ